MIRRTRILLHGAVQGVGFRPFVFRLARELRVHGYVLNNASGLCIEAEAEKEILDRFMERLEREKPPHAIVQGMECVILDAVGHEEFVIRHSTRREQPSAFLLPDLAICPECLRELFDPSDRRYLYPFLNCTHCGPRFSIIEALPYDRHNTSMKRFPMCPACRSEYENPADRRFHAQPTACPACGPRAWLTDEKGRTSAEKGDAILRASERLRAGSIVAFKGIGGFQLLVDAENTDAVLRLRQRKGREEKPFALMFPDVDSIRTCCHVSSEEERVLLSPAAPIVLLRKRETGFSTTIVSDEVAPANPLLGVMIPYAPLHHVLMREFRGPLVATSGNLSEEPLCIDNEEAFRRLSGIADCFLIHDRPVVRHGDDSIVRVFMGREMVLRRARGYAPLPFPLAEDEDGAEHPTVLATGGHQKNTIALAVNGMVFGSQHIGDLSTSESCDAFVRIARDFQRMYNACPERIARDAHPDYVSSQYADGMQLPIDIVQHHQAHVAACRLENRLHGPALGVSWDGTGYGLDGTVWGGEFFLCDDRSFERVACLRPFALPGGEQAVRESARSALGVLYELFRDAIPADVRQWLPCTDSDLSVLLSLLRSGINCPRTSSAGRLFDAVSSLAGVSHRSTYDGQSAMKLEWIADTNDEAVYPFGWIEETPAQLDWSPMIEAILRDRAAAVPVQRIATAFHNTLAEMITAAAARCGEQNIVLSGGCFQNTLLLERTVSRLSAAGFHPYWHQRIPSNDGGIAFGQIAISMMRLRGQPSGVVIPITMNHEES